MVRFYLRSQYWLCNTWTIKYHNFILIREEGVLIVMLWWRLMTRGGGCDDVINSYTQVWLDCVTLYHHDTGVISWGFYISHTLANNKLGMKLSKSWWRNIWTMLWLNKRWYYSLGVEYVYFLILWLYNMDYYCSWNMPTVEQIDWGTEWNLVSASSW